MMSLEPGIVDANILIYALDAGAPQHPAARSLLDAAREDPENRLYVTSQILCEFYSVVTNPRRVKNPRSPADALQAITAFLGFLQVLPVPVRAIDEPAEAAKQTASRGRRCV